MNAGGGGGGPWGQPPGGGNPWGRPPGGGRPGPGRPPQDLEDLIRRAQEGLRQLLPEGMGGGGLVVLLVVLVVLYAFLCAYRVQPDERGVVLRFGQYVRTAEPGLNFLFWPIEEVRTPAVTAVERIEIGFESGRGGGATDRPAESLMLSGDENIIDIDFVVIWKIDEQVPQNYLFNIRDPDQTIKKAAESVMREVIGRTDLQAALTEKRGAIETETQQGLQGLLDSYQAGVRVLEVQLQKVAPPEEVKAAFDDVQIARLDRERLRNEADRYRNDIIPRARGEAKAIIEEAEGYRQQIVAEAQGAASRFSAVVEAWRTAPDVTTRRLYLETMEQVLRNTPKLLLEEGAGNGVVPYLPLDRLQAGTPPATPAPTPARPEARQ